MATGKPTSTGNRRPNKPIMEKRRRARINDCLNELKNLILDTTGKDVTRHSKLEKADILKMTVQHLQTLHTQQVILSAMTEPAVLGNYRAGFSECAHEVTRFVKAFPGLDPTVSHRLASHLSTCMNGLEQASNGSSLKGLQQAPNDLQQATNDLRQASNDLQQASNGLLCASNGQNIVFITPSQNELQTEHFGSFTTKSQHISNCLQDASSGTSLGSITTSQIHEFYQNSKGQKLESHPTSPYLRELQQTSYCHVSNDLTLKHDANGKNVESMRTSPKHAALPTITNFKNITDSNLSDIRTAPTSTDKSITSCCIQVANSFEIGHPKIHDSCEKTTFDGTFRDVVLHKARCDTSPKVTNRKNSYINKIIPEKSLQATVVNFSHFERSDAKNNEQSKRAHEATPLNFASSSPLNDDHRQIFRTPSPSSSNNSLSSSPGISTPLNSLKMVANNLVQIQAPLKNFEHYLPTNSRTHIRKRVSSDPFPANIRTRNISPCAQSQWEARRSSNEIADCADNDAFSRDCENESCTALNLSKNGESMWRPW